MPSRRCRAAPADVRGLINLRGRIVTVIDMRTRLSLPTASDECQQGHVRDGGVPGRCLHPVLVEPWATSSRSRSDLREGNPATLDAVWREVADAVYRTDQGLLVALHIDRLLAIGPKS